MGKPAGAVAVWLFTGSGLWSEESTGLDWREAKAAHPAGHVCSLLPPSVC